MTKPGRITGIQALTPEWHDARRNMITATDVAAILGRSPYRTELETWAKLTGKLSAEEMELADNFYLKRGRYLEEPCARWYADERKNVELTPPPGLVLHPELDWFGSTPDWGVLHPAKGQGTVECKAPGRHKSKDWTWDVAPEFKIQLQVQLVTWGLEWGAIAAILEDDFRFKDFEHNEAFTDALIEKLIDWREKYWLTDQEPPANAKDLKLLGKIHSGPRTTYFFFGNDDASLAEEHKEVTAEIKELTKRKEELQAELTQAIGDRTYAVVGDDHVLSWKEQTRTTKPCMEERTTTFRVLRHAKQLPKGATEDQTDD